MNNNNQIVPIKDIQSMIFTIRGVQVMIDNDLAFVYEVETKALNQAVKRNIDRFPPAFRFQLTDQEKEELVTNCDQFKNFKRSTSIGAKRKEPVAICDRFKYLKHSSVNPYVFTEQGVSMLSAVLRSDTAVKVSIKIINAFVEMRRFIQRNSGVFVRLDSLERRQIAFESETEKNFEKVFDAFEAGEPIKQGIFYNGQIYDAYIFAADLIRNAKKSLILIDNYVDDSVLTLLSKRKKDVSVKIYTSTISKQLALDIKKHNAQYPIIAIEVFCEAHDRFLIVDEKDIYHIGASLKDLGKKWFAFSKFELGAMEMLKKLHIKNKNMSIP
ncbi:MAG: ORF6N domain-containing protein [Gammaproteobacteria bacterium]